MGITISKEGKAFCFPLSCHLGRMYWRICAAAYGLLVLQINTGPHAIEQ